MAVILSGKLYSIQSEAKMSESCHMRELELCGIGVAAMFQNPNGIPISGLEFERQCEYLGESVDCFNDYADKCFTQIQLGLFKLITNDLERFQEDLCNNGTELRLNYNKHAPCLRQVQRKHQHLCVTDLQVGLESIHKMDIGETRLTLFCW